jgi:hypothetical protein
MDKKVLAIRCGDDRDRVDRRYRDQPGGGAA